MLDKEIKDTLHYLLTHNKNYTRAQYYALLDLGVYIEKLTEHHKEEEARFGEILAHRDATIEKLQKGRAKQ